MGRFKTLSSIIIVIMIPVLVITLSLNIGFRLPDVYLFYFNDSRVVDGLYTSLSSTEMADALADFMNSFRPEEFQVMEDTGYDQLGIFDGRDSYNMLMLKSVIDITSMLCVVALILLVIIYAVNIKNDEKKVLRIAFWPAAGLTVILSGLLFMAVHLENIREGLFRLIGMRTWADGSKLAELLSGDFWGMMAIFLLAISLILTGLVAYLHYRLTRPPRIFY